MEWALVGHWRRSGSGARSLSPARRKRRLSSRAARAAAARSPASSAEGDDDFGVVDIASSPCPLSEEAVNNVLALLPSHALRRSLARRFAKQLLPREDKTFLLVRPLISTQIPRSRGPHGAGLPGVLAVVPSWFQPPDALLAPRIHNSPVDGRCFICGIDSCDADGNGRYFEGCVATIPSFPFPHMVHLRATTSAWSMLAQRLEPHGDTFACARCSGVCVSWEETLDITFAANVVAAHMRRDA